MQINQIYVASDHGGYGAKELTKKILSDLGYSPIDLGTNSSESVDYPDFGKALADAVAQDERNLGFLMCGTGIGISISANRNPKIRCALCHDVTTATLAREHNNANVRRINDRRDDKSIFKH